jgi:hypothetical protein
MDTTLAVIFAVAFGMVNTDQYVLPMQNYRHWTILQEICEKKPTYGSNEYLKNGKVCRWTQVGFYPYDKKKVVK